MYKRYNISQKKSTKPEDVKKEYNWTKPSNSFTQLERLMRRAEREKRMEERKNEKIERRHSL